MSEKITEKICKLCKKIKKMSRGWCTQSRGLMTRGGRDDVGEDQKDMKKECGRRERFGRR